MNRGKILRTFVLFICSICFLFPIIILLNTSLKTYEQIISWPPKWFRDINFLNYFEVIKGEKNILEPLLNSLTVAIPTMLICVIIGTMAAYGVTRYKFVGKRAFLFIVICTQMFSSIILVNGMYIIFKNLNILDTRLSLIIANTASSLPMTVWLLYSYFLSIPVSYEEAAAVDGSSKWEIIKNILFPLAIPGIITAGLFSFITSWGDIVYSNAFITNPQLMTISQALVNFRDLYKTTWNTQMAASVITIIPPFIIFLIIQKYLIKGVSQQGLKE